MINCPTVRVELGKLLLVALVSRVGYVKICQTKKLLKMTSLTVSYMSMGKGLG